MNSLLIRWRLPIAPSFSELRARYFPRPYVYCATVNSCLFVFVWDVSFDYEIY